MRTLLILLLSALTSLGASSKFKDIPRTTSANSTDLILVDTNGAAGWRTRTMSIADLLQSITGITARTNWALVNVTNANYLTNWATINTNAFPLSYILGVANLTNWALLGTNVLGSSGGGSATNIAASSNAIVFMAGGTNFIAAVTDTNVVSILATNIAKAATNNFGSAAYQSITAFQQALGYVPLNKAADNGGNLTNINGSSITNVAGITGIAQSQVTTLVTDLAQRAKTNDTRAVNLTNEANVFSGNIRLAVGTTNGIYANGQNSPLLSSDGFYKYGNGNDFVSQDGNISRSDGSIIYSASTGLGYYPNGDEMYNFDTLFGTFDGTGANITAIRGDHVNIAYGAGFTVATNGVGKVTVDSVSGGGTVTSVTVTAPGTGLTVSGNPVTGSGAITLGAGSEVVTNGFSRALTLSNNATIDATHSLTAKTIINTGVGATKVVGTDSSSQEVPLTLVNLTLVGSTLTAGGGSGVASNGGSAQFNYITNATFVNATNGGVSLIVSNLLTSTTNLAEFRGTNSLVAIGPGGGVHIGGGSAVAGSNLTVEGSALFNGTILGMGSNYFHGPTLIDGALTVNNGATNTFGPSIFNTVNSNLFLIAGANSNIQGTLNGATLTNLTLASITTPGNILTNGESQSTTFSNSTFVDAAHGFTSSHITNNGVGANKVVITDANGQETNAVLSGLSLSGGVLTATGSGAQTPWSSDINGAGFSLTNATSLSLSSTNGGVGKVYDSTGTNLVAQFGTNDNFFLTNQSTHWTASITNGGIIVSSNIAAAAFYGSAAALTGYPIASVVTPGFILTNGMSQATTFSNNVTVDATKALTVTSLTNLGVGATAIIGTDANGKNIAVGLSGLTFSGGTLSATGTGTGIQTNGGTGIGNVFSNAVFSAGVETKVGLVVSNQVAATTNLAEFRGTNASSSFGAGGGLHIGGLTSAGPSNLIVEGSATFTGKIIGSTQTNSGVFEASGLGNTPINASFLSSGTVNDSRLSANVPLLNISNAFSAENTFGSRVAFGTNGIHSTNAAQWAVVNNRNVMAVHTNGSLLVNVGQTNSGNIQSASHNTTGDLSVAGAAGITGLLTATAGIATVSGGLDVNGGAVSISTAGDVTATGTFTGSGTGLTGVGLLAASNAFTLNNTFGSRVAFGTNGIHSTNAAQWAVVNNRNVMSVHTNGSLLVNVGQTNNGNIEAASLDTSGVITAGNGLIANTVNATSLSDDTLVYAASGTKLLTSFPNVATAGLPLISGASARPTLGAGLALTNGESQSITFSNSTAIDITHGLLNGGTIIISNAVYQPSVVSSITIPMGSWFTNNLTSPASGLAPTNSGGWAFSNTATNAIRFLGLMPANWDAGTVQFELWGSSTGSNSVAGAGATNAVWGIRGAAIPSAGSFTNVTFGTMVFVTNHFGSANVGYSTRPDTTAAITVGNTPTANKTILWEIVREGGRPGDTATNGVYLADCRIWFKSYLTNSMPTASP